MFRKKDDISRGSHQQGRAQCQVKFANSLDMTADGAEWQAALIEGLSKILACTPEEIQVVSIQPEQKLLTLNIPSEAFERLIEPNPAIAQGVKELGIVQVKEVLNENYHCENIRRMLSKMFTAAELYTFCQKHFSTMLDETPSGIKKSALIDKLLNYTRQTSRLAHLLVFANQHNAECYEKYAPYHETPRMYPPQQRSGAVQRPAFPQRTTHFFNLTPIEFLRAASMGIGVSTALTFLLQRVLMTPVEGGAEILWLLQGTIALLGIVVGKVVSHGASAKHGELLGIVSVSCYWIGLILGNSLVYLTMSGLYVTLNMVSQYLLLGFMAAIAPLFSLNTGIIVLILGTYFAWKYARYH